MKKTALLLVITMLFSVFGSFGVLAEETAKGPQTEAFNVSATEATVLSPLYYTASNIYVNPDAPWYDIAGRTFATLEAYSYIQHYLAYDLVVEKAGAYRVTANIGSPSADAAARIYRPGKVTPATDSNFAAPGDVILAEASLKKTASSTAYAENDLGVIYLSEGANRIAVSNIAASGKAFYLFDMTLTPVEEDAPIVVSIRDAKEIKNSDGTDETIYGNLSTHVTPYITFGGGDYQIYDVTIPSDGLYSFTTFGGYGQQFTLTDITDEQNPVTLADGLEAPANGDGTVASPYEVAKISLSAGTHTLKLEAGVSSHYSYFTLRKTADNLGTNVHYAESGKSVKVPYSSYTSYSYTAGLDFTSGDGSEDPWREYKVYAEEAGEYSFVLNYATTSEEAGIIVDVNGETVLGDLVPSTGGWSPFSDVTMGTISLAQGENVIKLTPEGTFNMPQFTLVPTDITTVMASTASNLTTDSLAAMSYDGGTTVKLTNGQQIDLTIDAPTAGNYDLSMNASVNMGQRTVSVLKGTETAVTAEIAGEEHGEYSDIALGTVYLAEGENAVSVSLDEGYYMYIYSVSLKASADIAEPTQEPTEEPTEEPTAEPTEEPTAVPTVDPDGAKGPQEGTFPVAAVGETNLSPLYYTASNIYVNPDAPWYSIEGRTFATLEAYSYIHHCLTYDLYVEEAGAYRITADVSAPSANAMIQLLRLGKNSTATGDDLTYGDVVLSRVALKQTASSTERAEADLGVIWLDEGVNRITFANSRQAGKAFYFYGAAIEKVEADPMIVVSVRDYIEGVNYTDGADETIYSNITGMPYITPYISFGTGDYMTFDVTIPSDGLYSFTTYGAYGQKYTLTDITDAQNPVILVDSIEAPSNGVGNIASPYEAAKISLTAGTHTLKLEASVSSHYSYFTLKKVSEPLEAKQLFIAKGASITVPYGSFSANSITGGLDFGYNGWREYTVYAEEAGDYEFVVSYATTSEEAGLIVDLDGETVLGDILASTGGWSPYSDVSLGTISLKEGVNVLKLTPEATFNMPSFKLNRVHTAEVKASNAENVAADSLQTLAYNGGTSVQLSASQKLNVTIEAPNAGYYALNANLSGVLGANIVSVKVGDVTASEKAVSGTQLSAYDYVNLGIVYLEEGKNAITVTLDAGQPILFNTLFIDEVKATLTEDADAGTITAAAKLSGAFGGQNVMVVLAVYKTDANGVRKLEAVNMKNEAVSYGADLEISMAAAAQEADYTYETKLFILDNLAGINFVF